MDPEDKTVGDELATLRGELDQARSELAELRGTYATATANWRDATAEALRAANPTIPADLIKGDTVDELRSSVGVAAATVAAVLELNKAAASNGHQPPAVPAGATRPATPDLSELSPAAKIRMGLEARRAAN